jgi:hypothetical protein
MLLSRNQQLLSTDSVQSRQALLLLLLYFAKCELASKIFAKGEVLGLPSFPPLGDRLSME